MGQTDFTQKEIDPEAFAKAQERVKGILGEPGTNVVFTNPDLPSTPPAPPAVEPETKKTRTTVGKLLQRYQERVDVLTSEITAAEQSIAAQQTALDSMRFKLSVWREAIAEINSD